MMSSAPLMVKKSDGGYGYDSTDLAAIKYRLQELCGLRPEAVQSARQRGPKTGDKCM